MCYVYLLNGTCTCIVKSNDLPLINILHKIISMIMFISYYRVHSTRWPRLRLTLPQSMRGCAKWLGHFPRKYSIMVNLSFITGHYNISYSETCLQNTKSFFFKKTTNWRINQYFITVHNYRFDKCFKRLLIIHQNYFVN